MVIEVKPATTKTFDDVAIMVGPRKPDSSVCWCLSHRLDAKTNRELAGPARGGYVRELCSRKVAPGVLAYAEGEVVGWAAVAPRADLPFARSRKIPHIDTLPVWSMWCIRVRPGHRGRRISHALLAGGVAYARSQGAPAVEGYPGGQPRPAGRPHDGVRGHSGNVRTSRLHQGRRHGRGLRRVPTRAHATAPVLKACPRARLRAWHTTRNSRNGWVRWSRPNTAEREADVRWFGLLDRGPLTVSASSQGGLLARVDPAQTDALVDGSHVRRFRMRGREMDGWLHVDPTVLEADEDLRRLVGYGVAYARTLPPKR